MMDGTLWYARSDSLGADPAIGGALFQAFWNSLHERLTEPTTFAFVNRGVFLTLDDSPVRESLQALEATGSRFLSCGTCLDFYHARERLSVGQVGSIVLLQELMLQATKVITL
jgi:hypothetical protein